MGLCSRDLLQIPLFVRAHPQQSPNSGFLGFAGFRIIVLILILGIGFLLCDIDRCFLLVANENFAVQIKYGHAPPHTLHTAGLI